jgi:hypothetical protein
MMSYYYNQLCSCLVHQVIDFWVAKDKIPSSLLLIISAYHILYFVILIGPLLLIIIKTYLKGGK